MNESPPTTSTPAPEIVLAAAVAKRFQTPALVVCLDTVRRNITHLLDLSGGPARLRPHLKTTKTPLVWRELLARGLRHFKCATTREARILLKTVREEAIEDIDLLIAYPLRGRGLEAVAESAVAFPRTRLSILAEDPIAARDAPPHLGVFIDINPGMDRTGIPAAEVDRIIETAAAAGERFRGVHYYDGHIRESTADARRACAHRGYEHLLGIIAALGHHGLDAGEIVTSGTPTFVHALAFEGFDDARSGGWTHRVSPGTVIFHDMQYRDLLDEVRFESAAFVLSRIISRPRGDIVTCDAGSKAIAAEAGDPCAEVVGAPGLTALRPSEEHLPLRIGRDERPALGDEILLLPRHICPTVNLHDEVIIIENGNFKCIAPIAARGHDLC